MSDEKLLPAFLITYHSSLITRPMLSHDDRISGLARVEADGDARAGEVVGLARALFGVEELGRLVLDAVDLVVVEDVRDAAALVGDDVEDGALGDAPGAQERRAALGPAVGLLAPEDVEGSHEAGRGKPGRVSSRAAARGSARRR